MIPEGLMVLVSLTYAAAAVRMSRRGVLAQQLNAIESLASVDTICVDKTGTLTEAALRVVDLVPAAGIDEETVSTALATLAASASARNLTLQAIAEAFPAARSRCSARLPFSSRRRWSAIQVTSRHRRTSARPDESPPAPSECSPSSASARGVECSRSRRQRSRCPPSARRPARPVCEPLGLVVLAEELRPNVRETV